MFYISNSNKNMFGFLQGRYNETTGCRFWRFLYFAYGPSPCAVSCRHSNMVVRLCTYSLWNKTYYRKATKWILRLRHLLSYFGTLPCLRCREDSPSRTVILRWNNQFSNHGPSSAKERGSYNSSTLRSYQFSLTSSSSGRFFRYTAISGDVSIPILLLMFDKSTECGPYSNLNFVHCD